MNFSSREKRLLSLFGIVLFLAVYLNFFLQPQLVYIKKLSGDIGKSRQNYEVNLAIEKKVNGMDSDIKILTQKLKDMRTQFPPAMNYDELLITLRNLGASSGLKISSLNFSDPAPVGAAAPAEKTNGKNGAPGNSAGNSGEITDARLREAVETLGLLASGKLAQQDGARKKRVEIPDGTAYSVSVKLEAAGTNSQIKNFISRVTNLKCRSYFSSAVFKPERDGRIQLSADIAFLGIMDANASEYTILENGTWIPTASAGKSNLFLPFDGYTQPLPGSMPDNTAPYAAEAAKSVNPADAGAFDFSLRVMPFGDGMSPPTVTMAAPHTDAAFAAAKFPLIYGDSRELEKVELYVEEKEGRFYCKFRTSHDSYPDARYKELALFKPYTSGTVSLLVDSTPRKFDGDASGVSITVINKTTAKVSVTVRNDDKQKPRVKFEKPEGDVNVSYK